METAEQPSNPEAAILAISSAADERQKPFRGGGSSLEEEINALRRSMTEAFLKEESLTSDSVIEISRLLDTKIIEYMKHVSIQR